MTDVACGSVTTGTGTLTLAALPTFGVTDPFTAFGGMGLGTTVPVFIPYKLTEYADRSFTVILQQETGLGYLLLGADINSTTLARSVIRQTRIVSTGASLYGSTQVPIDPIVIGNAAKTRVLIGPDVDGDIPALQGSVQPALVPTFWPPEKFDDLVIRCGVRLAWAKSHACPCTYQGLDGSGYGIEGSAREDCQTCRGLGVYWDAFIPPFIGLIAFGGFLPMPSEPGLGMNEKWGQVANSGPLLTIPYTNAAQVWTEASTFDQVVEIDTPTRYSAMLKTGVQEGLPYLNGTTVAPSNAVTVWDAASSTVTRPRYTVAGTSVVLTGYPAGTPYDVEFYADQTYVLFRRSGGLPHIRPFGGGRYAFPKRFTLETFDLWMRQRTGQANPPGWNAATGGEAYPINSASSTL